MQTMPGNYSVNARRCTSHIRIGAAFFAATCLAALTALPAYAASGPLPLWQVSDGHGHVLYLAGAMHALEPADYPLPAAMNDAFAHSNRLVEELNLATISPEKTADIVRQKGFLPQGQTLAGAMNGDWDRAQALAHKAGINLGLYSNFKPWLAAVEVADRLASNAGYQADLGVDRYFSGLAQKRQMPITGLETFAGQLDFFDAMAPALQRRFLLQTLQDAPHAANELAQLHSAWRSGDLAKLANIQREDFAGYPQLRRTLLDQRNESWMGVLEHCLADGDTCFVVVGVEHMAGPKGLPALLRAAGNHVIHD
ncbi:MAG: TraB/GumN family protein [Gammaproteobacteria bacterium]